MLIFISVCLLLTVLYTALMLLYGWGWRSQHEWKLAEDFIPQTRISIIIPARNEEKNIGACIHSILQNDYPKELFELIVVDDHSSDRTAEIVESFTEKNITCLKLSELINGSEKILSYKKKAIETAVARSSGELIVTTDADCVVPKNWLKQFAAIYEAEQPVMILAPVNYTCNNSLVEIFQSLDTMTMQGITAATHFLKLGSMSNGGNLAFSKKAFYEIDGYKGMEHIASGDDYLLMVKMQKQFPGKISYLKTREAIVVTAPEPDWKSFFRQRIRWASKSGKYDDKKMTVVLMLVYLFNLSFAVLAVAGSLGFDVWSLFFFMLVIKTMSEIIFIFPVAGFFKKQKQLAWFALLQPLHIVYIVLAGFLGLIGGYEWKGRRVR